MKRSTTPEAIRKRIQRKNGPRHPTAENFRQQTIWEFEQVILDVCEHGPSVDITCMELLKRIANKFPGNVDKALDYYMIKGDEDLPGV